MLKFRALKKPAQLAVISSLEKVLAFPAPRPVLRSNGSLALCSTSKCARRSKSSRTYASDTCSSTSSETNLEFLCLTRPSGTGWRITQMSLPCFISGRRQTWQVRVDWRHFPSEFPFSLLDALFLSLLCCLNVFVHINFHWSSIGLPLVARDLLIAFLLAMKTISNWHPVCTFSSLKLHSWSMLLY